MGLKRVLAVAANTFRETVRERVLYNLVFFAILMTLCGLLLGQLSIRQDEKIIKDVGLAAMELFGHLIAIFIGIGLVSKEIDRKSLYPLLAKPLSRDELFLGKFAGLGFTLLVNVSAMAAGLFATLLVTYGRADPALLKAIFAIYLSLLLVVAIALLFSTVTSTALAAVCTVCLLIAGRFSDVVRNMKEVAPGVPDRLIDALYFALPNFRNFDLKDKVTYGEVVPWAVVGWITLYNAVYIAALLGIGLACFRKKEFQ
jgi:ABC-type transport system involved in multi-copper enzyme maturation permease subunit